MIKNSFALLFAFILSVFNLSAQFKHSAVTSQVPCEVRAVWLTTIMGLDRPQKPAVSHAAAEQQQRELCQLIEQLHQAGINTVLFQARTRSMTAYRSNIEPWDGVFTGTPGRAPLYDPLALAVRECHKRGMECHAWVVAFPVVKVAVARQLGKRALPNKHPELCVRAGEQWMMDPGVPGTATYLAQVCSEIVRHYDVDGIHLDYIRYPEKGIPFSDARSYKAYGKGQPRDEWRRANVNRCVQTVHDSVRAVRPWIKLSCSPVGKFSDLSRYSSMGWNARDAVFQNARYWLRKGRMDCLFPMMYFDGNHYYPFLADWHENEANRMVVPGLGIYFLNPREKNWPLLTVQRQLQVARRLGLQGQAYFRARFLVNNEKGLYHWLRNDFYATPALVPPMTWIDSIPPAHPIVEQSIVGNELRLKWQPVTESTPIYYNVYRLDARYGDVLLATRLTDTHYEKLLTLPALRYSRYVVTAVDAYGNESRPLSAD